VLEFFWWGDVFLLALPVMALLLTLGPRLLPEYKDPEAGRLDLTSAVMSLAAVLAVIFGLKQTAQEGASWLAGGSILVGLALGGAFLRRQLTLAHPFIDLGLFLRPAFTASLVTYGLGIFLVFGGFLFLPQYLQLVLGLSPLEAGLWTLPWALGFVVGSQLTPLLVRRIQAAYLMAGGLAFAALGFAVFTQVDAGSGFAVIVAGSVLFSLGTAPVFTLTNDLIIGSAPPERAGAAAGISETAAEFGGAFGIAIFGSIGVALYRGAVGDAIPAGVSPQAAEAARDTLGGAIALAAQLPGELGSALIEAARDAFTKGVHLAAAISAVGTIGLAVFVALALKQVRGVSETQEESVPSPDGPLPGLQDGMVGGRSIIGACHPTPRRAPAGLEQ
jgi:MFS transporter, DHA2 family, multidrug resistance protein